STSTLVRSLFFRLFSSTSFLPFIQSSTRLYSASTIGMAFPCEATSLVLTTISLSSLGTRDSTFRIALQNTLVWVVLALLVPTSLSLALAVALNESIFGRTIFRTVFYLPAILAAIAVATMWTWIYNPSLGLANEILRYLGLKEEYLPDWLGNERIALYSVFIAYVWQATGTPM